MKVDIHILRNSQLVKVGYLEIEAFNADRCWDICNWKSWGKMKPENLHANIDYCGHGLCFTNPDTNKMWLAKSIDWFVGNESEVNEYVQQNANESIWL